MILSRIENSRYSVVAPEWHGQTVVLLGGGPSLTTAQVEQVRRAHESGEVRCIAINDAYLLAPWADVHYAADARWHRWHTAGVEKAVLGLTAHQVRDQWTAFAGQKCSIDAGSLTVADESVHVLRNANGEGHSFGLSLDPGALVTGRNSGFQALNLAVLAGAARVLLLGFDAKPAADGRAHWFGEHPEPTSQAIYPLCRQAMSAAEDALITGGVEVLNCSPGSALDTFRHVDLWRVL